MIGKHHAFTGVVSGLTVMAVSPVPVFEHPVLLGTYTVGLFYGSLLPDIFYSEYNHGDSHNALIHKFLPFPTTWLGKLSEGRNLTHTLYFSVLYVFGFYWVLDKFGHFDQSEKLYLNGFFYLWLGLTFGFLFHLLMDYFSAQSIRFFAPLQRYDKWMYENHHKKVPKAHHYKKVNGKSTPCRHFWGRGYGVGDETEMFMVGLIVVICIVSLFIHWKKVGTWV